MADRIHFPEPTKREVRQRCGFGCVICGLPLYEYEHVDEYRTVEEHDPSNITLLCPNHHAEKTRKRLPADVVRAANADPHNRKCGQSARDTLHFGSDRATLDLGSNVATADGHHDLVGVMVDEIPLIGFRYEDGRYLLQANVFDQRSELVLKIFDNELVYSTGVWDIEYVGQTLTMRSASGVVIFEIQFIPEEGKISVPRGRMFCRGAGILIRPNEVSIVRGFNGVQTASGMEAKGATVVFQIGEHSLGRRLNAVCTYGVPYYPDDPPFMALKLIGNACDGYRFDGHA